MCPLSLFMAIASSIIQYKRDILRFWILLIAVKGDIIYIVKGVLFMPRKVKTVAQGDVSSQNSRKSYPDRDTRIAMAEEKIAQLEKLNQERRALIEKTEEKLLARKAALANSEAQLEKTIERRDRLIAAKNRPAGVRAAKSIEKGQIEQLKALLAAKGQTLDDLINSL